MTCPPKTDPVVKLVLHYIIGLRKGEIMPQKRYKPEQIINKLREAELALSRGNNIGRICRKLGVTEQTYYRWRKQYGGMKVEQARRFKELEVENTRLKKLVADLTLDKEILKEAASKNF